MPINTNVTNEQISVSVGETQVDVSVSGGVGPTGNSGVVSVSAPVTNSGTTTSANIGLSVGTGLAVAGGSLAVTYGTNSTSACRGDDSRLSDAREWSADTITQAEAEAGSATTRRAFTALRVFQAVAAWWAGSSAKAKLDGIATGATANATDAQLRDRSTHTGTQTASTIADFTTAVVAAAPPTTDASLLTTGTLPASRLPATAVTAGSYGSASSAATFTVDAAGRLTAAGSTSIAIAAGAVSGLAAIATSGSASDLGAGTVPVARLPLATTSVAGAVIVGSGLGVSSGTVSVTYGTGSGTACQGNDSRLSDSRTPTAHKSTHATGGSDALTAADIGAAASTHTHAASDITSGTIATARLGSGTASSSTFLRGDQTYAAPVTSINSETGAVTMPTMVEFTMSSGPSGATQTNYTGYCLWAYTIPSTAQYAIVEIQGAGSGGGSGRRGAAGSNRGGGGGGSAGAFRRVVWRVADLPSRDITVQIASGGAGGSAVTADDTNGNPGSQPAAQVNIQLNASPYPILLRANQGGNGGGGTTSGGSGGAGHQTSGTDPFGGSSGGAGGVGAAGTAGTNANCECSSGGGGGGGLDTNNTTRAGGNSGGSNWIGAASGATGGTAGGGNGGAGSKFGASICAIGGAGGGSSTAAAGGNGGNGTRGSGGGGGGASTNGYNSGAGGNGGDGFCRIILF